MKYLNQVPGPYEDTTCQMVVAYGNPNHSHLNTIREFRDKILESNSIGRKFVNFYYTSAPLAISVISRSRFLKKLTLYLFAYPSYLFSRTVLEFTEH
jgi:hypothetical protein